MIVFVVLLIALVVIIVKTKVSPYQLGCFVRKNKRGIIVLFLGLIVLGGWVFLDESGLYSFFSAKRYAKRGSMFDQYRLAEKYRYGSVTFVGVDIEKSVYWHEEAARNGYAKSAMALYEMYSDDFWVPMDKDKAMRWLNEAAKLGNSEAKEKLLSLQPEEVVDYPKKVKKKEVATVQGKRHEPRRVDLGGGSYIEYHENGTSTMVTVTNCYACNGTGFCMACGGAGGRWLQYSGMYWQCPMCALQTGICSSCKGEGKITTTSSMDASGNGHVRSSDGSFAYGNSGGMIMTSPDGKVSAIPLGSSSSSSRSSRYDDEKPVYMDKIIYAPNYTGNDNSRYCSTCGDVSPAHSHVKERVR